MQKNDIDFITYRDSASRRKKKTSRKANECLSFLDETLDYFDEVYDNSIEQYELTPSNIVDLWCLEDK